MRKFLFLPILIFAYPSISDACHQYICFDVDCLDTIVVCRQDYNGKRLKLDYISCKTYNKMDPKVPKCDILIEQKCPECPECPQCEECKEPPPCPECPQCEECKKCPECPWCPEPPKCEECKECPKPPPCEDCEECKKCEECEDCPKCEECEDCPKCEKCKTQPCEECKEKKCEKCECEDPEECEKCEKCDYKIPSDGSVNDAGNDSGKALAGGCNMTNDFFGSGLFVPILFFLFLLANRYRHLKKKVFASIIAIVFISSTSFALPTQTLRPAPGSYDFIATKDGKISLMSVKLFWHFEKDPLTTREKPSNRVLNTIIKERNTLHLMAAVPIMDVFQISLNLPVVLGQSEGPGFEFDNGVGDLGFGLKIGLYTWNSLNLSLFVDGLFPTSTASHTGEDNGSFHPGLIVSGSPLSWLDLSTNIGFKLRSDEVVSGSGFQKHEFAQLFTASAAARATLVDKDSIGLDLISDINLAMTMDSLTQEEAPLEWLNGLSARLPYGFSIMTGIGAGLTRGVGTPSYRVFASVSWSYYCKECKKEIKVVLPPACPKVECPKPKECPKMVQDFLHIPSIYFDTDKSTLRPKSIEILDKAVAMLKKYPKIRTVVIEGNTDHRASYQYNWKLSKRRAKAAMNYLVSKGIEIKRFQMKPLGEHFRLDKTGTANGMQLNRRVDFFLIKE